MWRESRDLSWLSLGPPIFSSDKGHTWTILRTNANFSALISNCLWWTLSKCNFKGCKWLWLRNLRAQIQARNILYLNYLNWFLFSFNPLWFFASLIFWICCSFTLGQRYLKGGTSEPWHSGELESRGRGLVFVCSPPSLCSSVPSSHIPVSH